MVKRSVEHLRLRLPDIGEVLDERYRVDEHTACGTYGNIYSATDLQTNERVAVKCLLPEAATRMAVVRRFEREIQVIRELTHPNVIEVRHFALTNDGCLYYVMEFLNGEDLGSRLRLGALPPRGAALVAIQVLLALEDAHTHDIIHRDLKPENVFLQTEDDGRVRVRVLDFGIAKIIGERGESVERLTMANEACGTPNYMAPEQIMGDDIGPWTDVYALGLILYEMLTGEMAIGGDTYIDTLRLQTTAKVTLPAEIDGTPLGAVVERSLLKKSAERYQTATDMKNAIIQAVSS